MRTRHRWPPARQLSRPLLLAAPVAVVLVLAACSGGGGAADAAQTGRGAPAAATGTPAPSPGDGSASPSAGGSATPGSTRTVTSMTSFTSPSGNIACYLAPVEGATTYARCDLREVSWPDPVPEPASGCAGHWGGGGSGRGVVGVGGREAQALCADDTVVDVGSATVLQYGESITLGDITCTSRNTGMECVNAATGHGFTVAKAAYDLR